MKIVGITHQTLINLGIMSVVAMIALTLKEPLPKLGLMMIQPTTVNAVPELADEGLSMGGVENEEEESAIGFHAQL